MSSGIVFNIQRYSIHDGPGIRTTVFLKGCPLNCWWCHNPEGQNFQPVLIHFPERCRLCGRCIVLCPNHAIAIVEGRIEMTSACRACGECVDLCYAGARELAGRRMELSEVMREVEKDVVFFDDSGGGVTFSGGEPLSQPDFLEALLSACRARGIHTVLETCGYAPPRTFASAVALADLVLYDLKLVDAVRHRLYTGRSNDWILENLLMLSKSGRPFLVRVPIVPSINDNGPDLREIAEFLRRATIRRLSLLSYHQTGRAKYERLHIPYRLGELAPPSPDRMAEIAASFSQRGFEVTIGG